MRTVEARVIASTKEWEMERGQTKHDPALIALICREENIAFFSANQSVKRSNYDFLGGGLLSEKTFPPLGHWAKVGLAIVTSPTISHQA